MPLQFDLRRLRGSARKRSIQARKRLRPNSDTSSESDPSEPDSDSELEEEEEEEVEYVEEYEELESQGEDGEDLGLSFYSRVGERGVWWGWVLCRGTGGLARQILYPARGLSLDYEPVGTDCCCLWKALG